MDSMTPTMKSPAPARLTTEILSEPIQFSCLREEWDELAERAKVTPFQSFDWQYLWWRHLGSTKGRSLHIVLFRNDDSMLVGIAPMILDIVRIAGADCSKRLRFLACDLPDSPMSALYDNYPLTDYLDFIVAPGWEKEVALAWVHHLHENGGLYDRVECVNLQSSSFLISEVVPLVAGSDLVHRITRSDVCPRIILNGSLEAYLDTLESNHRRRLKQARRTAESGNPYALRIAETQDEIRTGLEDLVRLHQKRWNSMGSPGLFYDPRFQRFLENVIDAWCDQGKVWLGSAVTGAKTIASRLCFTWKGVMYDYVSGIDDEADDAKKRPGLALLVSAVDCAARKGCIAVDLLRGDEQYKMQLASEVRYNWNLTICNPRRNGTLRSKVAWLARNASSMSGRIRREVLMLRILIAGSGIATGMHAYVRKRTGALMAKLGSLGKKIRATEVLDAVLRSRMHRLKEGSPLVVRILRSLERDKEVPWTRKAFKAFVFLKSMALSGIHLRRCTSVGRRCRARGRPYIVNDGSIVIGDDFNFNSRIVRGELATGPKGRIEIGHNVRINFGALISAQELVKIGNNVSMGPYAIITDSDFHSVDRPYSPPVGVPTFIGDNVWLGARVTVLKGSSIGEGSIISAGSVVAGRIPPNVIAAGNPARVVRNVRAGNAGHAEALNGSVPREITSRVLKVFGKTFGMEKDPDLNWGPKAIPQWDSLGHLNVILNLESEFGIRIPEDAMTSIGTIGDACKLIAGMDHARRPVHNEDAMRRGYHEPR